MNFLVVSPHRDDAAFSLALTITGWLEAGHTITVLNCFTRSAWAPYSDADTLHLNDRTSFVTALRRREDLAWNKQLGGRLQFHDLDLFDAPLRLACTVPEVFTVDLRPGDRALVRVAGAIGKLARTADAVFTPLALGNHVDHRIARGATTDSLSFLTRPTAFYEDLPYAAEAGVSGANTPPPALTEGLSPTFAIAPAADIEAAIRRKTRLVECYDSQIDSSVVRAIANFAAPYKGRERFWVAPGWFSSPLADTAHV